MPSSFRSRSAYRFFRSHRRWGYVSSPCLSFLLSSCLPCPGFLHLSLRAAALLWSLPVSYRRWLSCEPFAHTMASAAVFSHGAFERIPVLCRSGLRAVPETPAKCTREKGKFTDPLFGGTCSLFNKVLNLFSVYLFCVWYGVSARDGRCRSSRKARRPAFVQPRP